MDRTLTNFMNLKEEDDLRRRNFKKMSEQSETAGGKDERKQ